MPRGSRKAPKREYDPLDTYSTWDVRVARCFYYAYIIAAVIVVLGVWGVILDILIATGKLELFLEFNLGIQAAIIIGAITGHLFLLVLFYAMFRGGIVRMCRILFKDRLVAKKWEDYTTLRWLYAIALLGAIATITALVLGFLPTSFWEGYVDLLDWMVEHLTIAQWILIVGLELLLYIGIVFLVFVWWNHGVYVVLKNVKRIEEEERIDKEIDIETLKSMDEKERMKAYKSETGKKASYRGKETKGYTEWKQQKGLK